MSKKKNKIKYGIKNAYYAVMTEDEGGSVTYETPVSAPGAVSISLEPQIDELNIPADDREDYYSDRKLRGYEGDLEMRCIDDDMRVDLFGDSYDANNVLVESAASQSKKFALLFEFSGDAHQVRHVLYNCIASRPNVESETKGESIESKTDTLKLTSRPIPNGNDVKAKTNEKTTQSVYDSWFSKVYMPSEVSDGGGA